MVLAAGLTSRREPASYSRRLVELAFDGVFDLVVTEILLEELFDVLIDRRFVGRVSDDEAVVFITGLATVAAIVVADRDLVHAPLTADPDDDYLAGAALATDAFLVTRDDAAAFEHVRGLASGRPGSALRLIGALDEEEPR